MLGWRVREKQRDQLIQGGGAQAQVIRCLREILSKFEILERGKGIDPWWAPRLILCRVLQIVARLCCPLRARHNIRAVPPAATECLKECSGVGVAVSLGLNQTDDRRLVGLFGSEERKIAGWADAQELIGIEP